MNKTILLALLMTMMLVPAFAQPPQAPSLTAQFDQVLSEAFPASGPGCAAIVAQNGEVLYKAAFGKANIELDVPMKVDNVFRIGSITKQFTAVAILQLAEQGKLNLQDPITRFLPDYPTQGHTITIEHLLTHTSGIKSYTSMPSFDSVMTIDYKPTDFINFFKNEPMDFAPGAEWRYNNSGYFLLGVIIEKVSGKTYPQYLQDHFFKPLGMSNSFYGSDLLIIPNRAAGYQDGKAGIENASALSMTLPYAAGSIQSTVEDLYKWNRAVHGYKLVSKPWLDKAFTPYRLNNGDTTTYGYGWVISNVQGDPSIEHGGGINGFLTNGIYLPKQDVFVAVFSNSTGKSPDPASNKLAALAIGKPISYKAIPVDAATLASYPGVYEYKNEQRIITTDSGRLYSQRSGGSKYLIKAYEKDKFFFDNSLTTLQFVRDKSGKVTEVISLEKEGSKRWTKSNKPIEEKKAINLSAEALEKFTGEYKLNGNFSFEVTRSNNQLFVQATGQPKFELFADSPTSFFLKEVDARLIFNCDGSKPCDKLTLEQGGQKLEAKRVN